MHFELKHALAQHIDALQHKGVMSTKPVFEKIAQIQRSYVPQCGHTVKPRIEAPGFYWYNSLEPPACIFVVFQNFWRCHVCRRQRWLTAVSKQVP